ncbi:hypothetical protein [Candidatus Uabimicrobium sp. HlEnr_7]|uniref:hypothetical protein n=1 Tax=Candidatus Uabimicrobium helgolandensis TaxID=3095367 RepID=UPI003556E4F8
MNRYYNIIFNMFVVVCGFLLGIYWYHYRLFPIEIFSQKHKIKRYTQDTSFFKNELFVNQSNNRVFDDLFVIQIPTYCTKNLVIYTQTELTIYMLFPQTKLPDSWQKTNISVEVLTPWESYITVAKKQLLPGITVLKPSRRFLSPILLDIKLESIKGFNFFYRYDK